MVGFKPIEPSGLDLEGRVCRILLEAHVPEDDAGWLAKLISSRETFEEGSPPESQSPPNHGTDFSDMAIGMACHVGFLFGKCEGNRNAALTLALQAFLHKETRVSVPVDLPNARTLVAPPHGKEEWDAVNLVMNLLGGMVSASKKAEVIGAHLPQWLAIWLFGRSVDWGDGVAHSSTVDQPRLKRDFLWFLWLALSGKQPGFVAGVVDRQGLRQRSDNDHLPLSLGLVNDIPTNPWFWLRLSNENDAFGQIWSREMLHLLGSEVDETVGLVALNLHDMVSQEFRAACDGTEPMTPGISRFWADGLRVLLSRSQAFGEIPTLRAAAFRFAIRCIRAQTPLTAGPSTLLPAEDRVTLTAAAQRDLGVLRTVAREANAQVAEEALDWPLRAAAADYLFRVESPWKALKPLFLAISALAVPCVALDLRYWTEPNRDPPPFPWAKIPERIAMMIHSLRDEELRDPGLKELRSDMAGFCLERLRTKEQHEGSVGNQPLSDSDFVESRPEWRYFYIRALRELAVNPRGRGHHVLHWVSENDPSPEVREAAGLAHKELRHEQKLADGLSARRPLLAAFWWLRQAHLFALGKPPDGPGAQRTREKEVTRTGMY